MNIYTYFVQVPEINYDGEIKVLEAWKETWSKAGWNPVVLTKDRAESSPRFKWYDEQIRRNPFMNSDTYESACFHRWLAMTECGGGVHSDYDCLNNGLTPEDMMPHLEKGDMTVFEPPHVPSLVCGSYREFQRMVDLFAEFDLKDYRPDMLAHTRNGTAASDMLIIANKPESVKKSKVVWEFEKEPSWESAKAIHFSHWACEGKGKLSEISKWMKR